MWMALVPHAFTHLFKILVIDIAYFLYDARPNNWNQTNVASARFQPIGPEEARNETNPVGLAMDKTSKL